MKVLAKMALSWSPFTCTVRAPSSGSPLVIRGMGGDQIQQKEEILIEIFEGSANPMIRRLVILVMAKWSCHYWLSDAKKMYGAMSVFERRAFIVASYLLGDEGSHWRDHVKGSWSEAEKLTRDWYSSRFQANKSVPL